MIGRATFGFAVFGFAFAVFGFAFAVFGFAFATFGFAVTFFGFAFATFGFAFASFGFAFASFAFAVFGLAFAVLPFVAARFAVPMPAAYAQKGAACVSVLRAGADVASWPWAACPRAPTAGPSASSRSAPAVPSRRAPT